MDTGLEQITHRAANQLADLKDLSPIHYLSHSGCSQLKTAGDHISPWTSHSGNRYCGARITTKTRRPTSYGDDTQAERSEVISPRMRKLLLGLCIPLGVLFFSIISYIIWYIRHRRKKSKASSRDPVGSSDSTVTERGKAVPMENKDMREPTHREVFMAERSGPLPPGSTDDYIQPEAEEDRRRLRYQEESLRERRAQQEVEKKALRIKRAKRQSAM